MTDQELIKRLRHGEGWPITAADRIEELVEERDTARRLLGAATQMQTETQAKLTKAVEALREIYGDGNATGCNPQWMTNTAAKALAELEGQ